MTDLLSTYEKNFRKNNDIIESNINKITLFSNKDTPENKKPKINKANLLEETDKLIEEQTKILKQMEIEVCSLMNRDDYEDYNTKIISFKKNFNLNKKKFNEIYLKEEAKNISFMSENILLSEHNNILMNKERYMFQRNEKLQQVKRSLSSTENIGNDIIVNMDSQTKNMKNISGKIRNMNTDLDDSNHILNKMKKRGRKNKYIIIFFCVLFCLILISVLGIKIYKNYK